ncbi:oligoribonuclease [Antiquaquibacter soli]|uniref:Oligoribonuclease n=1 Tax=Antiquaquibacter soli TaxID=3064523 RepID=A0ABT9BMZ1_9MICO|nr:oligoribonuclease [Protaetiibacter sp. WY-16]MDO7882365.1 oligoribonuclease [Protaetiibacter sp. WY-16]
MSGTPELTRGDEYVVFYSGGPYSGQSDTRISTDGSWDDEVTVIAAVDGKETQLVYSNPVAHLVGSQVQVTYSWDQPDSEPLEALDERNDD